MKFLEFKDEIVDASEFKRLCLNTKKNKDLYPTTIYFKDGTSFDLTWDFDSLKTWLKNSFIEDQLVNKSLNDLIAISTKSQKLMADSANVIKELQDKVILLTAELKALKEINTNV
jgi:hypothetical protein